MNLFLKFICLVSIAACLFLIVQGKVLTESIIGLLACCIVLLYLFKEDEYYEWLSKFRKKKFNCRIESDHFYFPSGYYFRHSSLKRSKKLPFAKVQEIRINTYPISALINSNELIFLLGITSKDIDAIDKLVMKVKRRRDNWSLLCEEFLDTELSKTELQNNIETLEKAGIPKIEQSAIKKRLKNRFLLRTLITWEWGYYGQYHVLTELWPLTKEKYWWTMDIALR